MTRLLGITGAVVTLSGLVMLLVLAVQPEAELRFSDQNQRYANRGTVIEQGRVHARILQ